MPDQYQGVVPDSGDIPFNEPEVARIGPAEKLTSYFEPEQNQTTFYLTALGISKHPDSEYVVYADSSKVYESAIPPTDVDDMTATFIPPLQFSQELRVVAKNLSASTSRTYSVQPIGWEEGA